MFADDVKLLKSIYSLNDCSLLQQDLSSLQHWCNASLLTLNQSKCTHLQMSLSTRGSQYKHHYSICESPLVEVTNQRDLGVSVSCNLSWSTHYGKICQKAYGALNLIKRSLPANASISIKKHLYIALVRSQLSYCSQLWKPYLVKDITCLERVQRRSTKFILNDYTADYKSRLRSLRLLPIMLGLDLHDLIFLVKCLKDSNDIMGIRQHVSFKSSSTRAGSTGLVLSINYTRTSSVRHFYSNRIVRIWNTVHPSINLSESTPTNKFKLIQLLWSHFDQHFDPSNVCSYHLACPCANCHSSCRSL